MKQYFKMCKGGTKMTEIKNQMVKVFSEVPGDSLGKKKEGGSGEKAGGPTKTFARLNSQTSRVKSKKMTGNVGEKAKKLTAGPGGGGLFAGIVNSGGNKDENKDPGNGGYNRIEISSPGGTAQLEYTEESKSLITIGDTPKFTTTIKGPKGAVSFKSSQFAPDPHPPGPETDVPKVSLSG